MRDDCKECTPGAFESLIHLVFQSVSFCLFVFRFVSLVVKIKETNPVVVMTVMRESNHFLT